MLKGIDISSWQSVSTAGMDGIDFVIVKATQGTWAVSRTFNEQYELAKSKGRLLGVYHYAEGGDPVKEADFFISKIQHTLGEAIPVLDWESGENISWGSYDWCRTFVDYFHARTNIWPMIYIQASGIKYAANCANDCALWVAGYPTDEPGWDLPEFLWSTSPWPTYTLWQFTSSRNKLDLNVANLDHEGWKAIARGGAKQYTKDVQDQNTNSNTTSKTNSLTLDELANGVIAGHYGDGETRKTLLGVKYEAVQALVNHILEGSDYTEAVVKGVLAGYFGDGEVRKAELGSRYEHIQAAVNRALEPKQSRYHVVLVGENLTVIAETYGVTIQKIVDLNGISNPDLIYVGQILRID